MPESPAIWYEHAMMLFDAGLIGAPGIATIFQVELTPELEASLAARAERKRREIDASDDP
jgi:hypothetical protein